MKYTCEIEIDLPVAKVIELFDNPENLKHWQPGLKSFEHLSGMPGEPGARSRLRFQMRKREIEMIETVTVRNLPEEFSGTYEAPGVFNTMRNQFHPLGPGKTRYVSYVEFRFTSLMMKIIGLIMPETFKKQTQKYLQHFKEFAEEGKSVL